MGSVEDDRRAAIDRFTTRVRQMVLAYHDLEASRDQLRQAVAQRDERIADLEAQLAQSRADYTTLKTARMLAVGDNDVEQARRRIGRLIRDVDRCITMISEKS